ncbi:MAG: hypothetical protein ACTSQL_09950 [Promethearchaeota archaeon]
MVSESEFKVNEFLSLKFEEGVINIYVKGKKFPQSQLLSYNIPLVNFFDRFKSIDEAYEKIDKESVSNQFQDQCLSLREWAKNKYDTRLLHRVIAYPLLKKLVQIGDPLAKEVFEGEIVKKFKSGHIPSMNYLIQSGYLTNFNEGALVSLYKKFTNSDVINQDSQEFLSIKEKLDKLIINAAAKNNKKITKYLFSDEEPLTNLHNKFTDSDSITQNSQEFLSIKEKLNKLFVKEEIINKIKTKSVKNEIYLGKTIYLLNIGDVEESILSGLKKVLEKVLKDYIDSIKIIPGSFPLINTAYDPKTRQHLASSILTDISAHFSSDRFLYVIGVMNQDIYIKKRVYIFGLANITSSLVSILRLQSTFRREPKDPKLTAMRTAKVIMRLLVASFKISKCNNKCANRFSQSVSDLDRKPDYYCESCSRELKKKIDENYYYRILNDKLKIA